MDELPRRTLQTDDDQAADTGPLIPEVLDRDDPAVPRTTGEPWDDDQQSPFPWQLFEGVQVRSLSCGPGCVAVAIVACIVLALVLNLFI